MLVREIYDSIERAESVRQKLVCAQNSNTGLPTDVQDAMHEARTCLVEYISMLSDLKSVAGSIRVNIDIQPDM